MSLFNRDFKPGPVYVDDAVVESTDDVRRKLLNKQDHRAVAGLQAAKLNIDDDSIPPF